MRGAAGAPRARASPGRPVQRLRGVEMALLVTDDSVTHATIDATVDVDRLGVLANLHGLLGVASDISCVQNRPPASGARSLTRAAAVALSDDLAREVILEGPRNTRLLLYRMRGATLVLKVHKAAMRKRAGEDLRSAVHVLRRVCLLRANVLRG